MPVYGIVLVFCMVYNTANGFRCDRRPYGSSSPPGAADGRFRLLVVDTDDTYIPEQLYTVKITETDNESRFAAFVISAEGDTKTDPSNPRRTISLHPGELRPQNQFSAKFSDRCPYSVEQAVSSSKSYVEVYWQAPPSGSGCVTLRAMVAENEELWYEDGPPLTRRLCEDTRQPDDVAPQLNFDCQVCDEAKYEVTFTGVWSRNTHPRLYPENDWVPRYSDLVGASHSADLVLWTPGSLASDGLRQLAEYANSTDLENEIREKIGGGVRTLIKGKGHGYRRMNKPTHALFRADKLHHLVTVAVSLHPSPDWFLGVTRFELCQLDNTWLTDRELNLYPWDAGTDSGVSYESPNMETYPKDAIGRVQMSSYDKNSPFYEVDIKDLHPFGRLRLKLIQIYKKNCEEQTDVTPQEAVETIDNGSAKENEENPSDPVIASRYQTQSEGSGEGSHGREKTIEEDPSVSEDCPMSQWQEWSACEGECEAGHRAGFRWRERYHLVDGMPVEKYEPNTKKSRRKEVPKQCKTLYDDFQRAECEENCEDQDEKEITAERRKMNSPVAPGKSWFSRKRDMETEQN